MIFKWKRVDPQAPSDRADFIRKWISDLCRPDLKRATNVLKNSKGGFCCLGVATSITANFTGTLKYDKYYSFGRSCDTDYLPQELCDFLSMAKDGKVKRWEGNYRKVVALIKNHSSLANANDNKISFTSIARLIKTYPQNIFDNLSEREIHYINASPIKTRAQIRNERKANV